MRYDTNAIRTEPAVWGQALKEFRLLRIFDWRGREYALLTPIRLETGPQRLEAIDLTSFDDTPDPFLRAARFHVSCPEPPWLTSDPEDSAEIRQCRRYVAYQEPDEGHCSLMTEYGDERWVDAWCVQLVVRLVDGSREDYREAGVQLMDELEQAVDAGAGLV